MVLQVELAQLDRAVSISHLGGGGVESAAALAAFAASLPPTATLTVVTDESGKATLEGDLPGDSRGGLSQISGHAVDFIII